MLNITQFLILTLVQKFEGKNKTNESIGNSQMNISLTFDNCFSARLFNLCTLAIIIILVTLFILLFILIHLQDFTLNHVYLETWLFYCKPIVFLWNDAGIYNISTNQLRWEQKLQHHFKVTFPRRTLRNL